jgi:hypothetical protein
MIQGDGRRRSHPASRRASTNACSKLRLDEGRTSVSAALENPCCRRRSWRPIHRRSGRVSGGRPRRRLLPDPLRAPFAGRPGDPGWALGKGPQPFEFLLEGGRARRSRPCARCRCALLLDGQPAWRRLRRRAREKAPPELPRRRRRPPRDAARRGNAHPSPGDRHDLRRRERRHLSRAPPPPGNERRDARNFWHDLPRSRAGIAYCSRTEAREHHRSRYARGASGLLSDPYPDDVSRLPLVVYILRRRNELGARISLEQQRLYYCLDSCRSWEASRSANTNQGRHLYHEQKAGS